MKSCNIQEESDTEKDDKKQGFGDGSEQAQYKESM